MLRQQADYLFRRPGSQNWWIKFQYPAGMGRKKVQKALGTPDRKLAEQMAVTMIAQHKLDLWEYRNRKANAILIDAALIHPIGESTLHDGTRVIATEDTAILIKDGNFREIDNSPLFATHRYDPADPRILDPLADLVGRVQREPPKPALVVDQDMQILDDYLGLKVRNKYYNAESRRTWAEFKHFVSGKLIKDCTRKDGRAFADHLRAKGLKTATIVKLINYLAAPINHANETGDLKGNPFFRVIMYEDDSKEVIDFSEDDMRLMRDHVLPKLGRDERLMWLVLASTGMRHSEVFSIREEFEEEGVRYVKVGSKTESSKRKVPLPECLIPHLPTRITGPLFEDLSLKNISKNLLRAVRRAGITDPRKVTYSTRHRAHTRLRNAGCDRDVQREIVGHETGEAHVKYGQFPILVLQRWINEIKF